MKTTWNAERPKCFFYNIFATIKIIPPTDLKNVKTWLKKEVGDDV